ncbi:MAG: DbpA RNA-binding domain protein [Gemmatimonadetes bacterium]|nr:DbpA RNA-binding domain protein [Gemmatimonadota bacterium]
MRRRSVRQSITFPTYSFDNLENYVEADAKEPTGVTRGQNAVQVIPFDWSVAEQSLATLIDRIDPARAETQLLVVTSDAENAVSAAQAIVSAIGERAMTVVAATASPRASRLLRAAPAHIVTGAPSELVALLQSSALKAESVRGVIFAWLDPILETPDVTPLETLLGELPKDGARVVFASALTPAYEAFIERYARRARRAAESVSDDGSAPFAAEYVSTSASARASSLRRLLDALDLPRAVLYARTAPIRAEGSNVARSLGYGSDAVRFADAAETTNDPMILLELPASREELRTIVGAGARKIYALVLPSQLSSLRAVLGGGAVTPVALIEAAERARGKDASLRASLRDVLTTSDVRREVLALEPLLEEFDGIEIAAAALKMLEQQRPSRPTASASAAAGPMQRLFVNLGEKDGIRAPEIVTAITTEAGIPGSQVGRVEVRDTHSIVEIAAAVTELVLGKINGATVRGRKVQARLDVPKEERPERSGPPARGGSSRGGPPSRGPSRGNDRDRPTRTYDRGDRPERPARSFDRGDRPARPFDTGDRPARPFDKTDRPARSFDKGDRPARPFDKGDRPARPFTRKPDSGAPRKFDRDGGSARPTRPRPPRSDA